MFSKGKDESYNDMAIPQPSTPPKRKSGGAASILGPDLVITGSVHSEGDIQLDGSIEGDVRAGSLTIGENASVKGEVEADLAVVHGHLVGSLRAREVRLASSSRIEGDVIHSTLSIEAGAYFEGQCRRVDDPIGDSGKSSKKSYSGGGVSSSSSSEAKTEEAVA